MLVLPIIVYARRMLGLDLLYVPNKSFDSIELCLQEMLISPVLLDFLEQALEPIPMMQLIQGRGSKSGKLSQFVSLTIN